MDQKYNDTEYQLNEDNENMVYDHEATESKEHPDGQPSLPKKKLVVRKRNAIIILIAVIVLIIFAYKLYSLVFSSKTIQTKNNNMPSISKALTKPKTTAVTSISVAKPSTSTASKVNVPTKLETSIQKSQETNVTKLNQLQTDLSGIKINMTGLQTAIQGLSKQINQNEIKSQARVRQQINTEKAHETKIRRIKRYFVRAVIPGRAWLNAADGTAITVAVGNRVPGYGVVTAVDAYSGTVDTSSGVKIFYGVSGE